MIFQLNKFFNLQVCSTAASTRTLAENLGRYTSDDLRKFKSHKPKRTWLDRSHNLIRCLCFQRGRKYHITRVRWLICKPQKYARGVKGESWLNTTAGQRRTWLNLCDFCVFSQISRRLLQHTALTLIQWLIDQFWSKSLMDLLFKPQTRTSAVMSYYIS